MTWSQAAVWCVAIDKPLRESRGTHDMVRRLIDADVLTHILLGQFPPQPIPLQPKGI